MIWLCRMRLRPTACSIVWGTQVGMLRDSCACMCTLPTERHEVYTFRISRQTVKLGGYGLTHPRPECQGMGWFLDSPPRSARPVHHQADKGQLVAVSDRPRAFPSRAPGRAEYVHAHCEDEQKRD